MNSTAFYENGQLFLNLSIPLELDFQDPVQAQHALYWSLDYSCFSRQKKVRGRPNAISTRQMMFILAYASHLICGDGHRQTYCCPIFFP